MPKRKLATQSTKGGWDVLPHGMGEITKRLYNTRSTAAPRDKGTIMALLPVSQHSLELAEDTPNIIESPSVKPAANVIADTAASLGALSGPTKASLARARAAQASTGIQTLIVIKGIAVSSNTAVKVGITITAGITQIKNPHFKLRSSRGAFNLYGLTVGRSPYPHRVVPTPEACEEVHRVLTELHGEVVQPEKPPVPSLEVAGCGEVPCVLDALLRTLISGNTQMVRADAAIKKLAEKYGTTEEGTGIGSINWEKVRLSSLEELVKTIKPAGCAGVKGAHIKAILDMVHKENQERAVANTKAERLGIVADSPGASRDTQGQATIVIAKVKKQFLSLDHMHSMTKDEAMVALLCYPGIGVKTAACVILFCLRIPCFAVDTHVHKFCQWLGWVPPKASELDSYNHGEFKIPDHLKYGLHQLFIRHGQQCYKCRKATRPGSEEWNEAPECPLEHLLNRGKTEVALKTVGKAKHGRKRSKMIDSSDEEQEFELPPSETRDVEQEDEELGGDGQFHEGSAAQID